MILKNSKLVLTIEALSGDGQGIAHSDGQVVFVPYTAEGDVVEVHIIKATKTYAVGKVVNIITPSKKRICIDCTAFGKCGGCSLRHISLDEEQKIKTQSVKDVMERIGGIKVEVDDALITPHDAYRNKAQLPVTEERGELKCGFFASFSHRIVEGSLNCLATPKIFSDIAGKIIDFLKDKSLKGYDEKSGQGLLRHLYMRINRNGKIMLCLVLNSRELVNSETEQVFVEYITTAFPDIVSVFVNENTKNTNAILGEKFRLLFGTEYFEDELLGVRLCMSPDSFFQVNREGAELVYKTAFSMLEGKNFENVYDLYCGVGSIGLTLFSEIKKGNLNVDVKRLFGVEIVQNAVKWAKHNAKINKIENANFYTSDSTDITKMELFDQFPPSLVILDPPRKGTTETLLKYLSDKNVGNILYISCNPATLARDMSFLYKEGYTADKVVPVNLFPRTSHVECCVLLCRS